MATKRAKGKKWEYIVKRAKLLPKPLYLVFDDEEEGDAYVARLEAMLDRGIVPEEFLETSSNKIAVLADLIKSYLTHNTVPPSDVRILNVLIGRIGATPLTALTFTWVEKWIAQLKVEYNLAPSTIRHQVGALARCFDYAGRRNIVPLLQNPIRQLPKRYATYTERERQLAQKHHPEHTARMDTSRERRLMPGEDERIRAAMDRQKVEGKERPLEMRHQAAMELLYDLALETAMRLREMYTLTLDQVSLERRTIFLERTKNGNQRQVPLSTVAVQRIQEYMRHVENGTRNMAGFKFDEGRLFPWWDGDLKDDKLVKLTAMLSGRFATIFKYAGVDDFRFHDLRHEATSRFFERTALSDFEIMKITGHSSTRMLARYANLRGSSLAERLW